MAEIIRTRDVVVLATDVGFPVMVDSALVTDGWPGGQGVTWVDSPNDEFTVSFSDGQFGGFLLWGSNEDSDQFISMTGNQPKYAFGVLCMGSWLFSTRVFEKHTLESRNLGPLVENIWTVGNQVFFSLRGLFTTQDEWTIDGDPRAPNNNFLGTVVQAPRANNSNYVMIQTTM